MIFAQINAATGETVAPIDRLHGIRDRFATGGSVADFVLVITLILLALAALYGIMHWGMRRRRGAFFNPRKLFDKTLRSLSLRVDQRDLVRKIARDLRLQHPTVLLLSPQLLNLYGNQWMSATDNVTDSQRTQLDDLSTHLFGRH
ncbi:MAG: hypothetical protein DHS20C16_30300 [Phycisphaerae bacterium]|nr:MAG: hypothetical protein DHS20C16_30300 [Phycisphaerae bacterium]